MRTWKDLFGDVDRLDLSERRVQAERAAFERWASAAEERTLEAVHAAACLRAQELRDRTGLGVSVQRCVVTPSRRPDGTPWAIVSMVIGSSRVDVYSVRQAGEAPTVHLGVLRAATTTRFPVFASVPGVLVVRRPDDGVDLLPLPLEGDAAGPRPRTTIDALVLRAFELLIGAHRSLALSPTIPAS